MRGFIPVALIVVTVMAGCGKQEEQVIVPLHSTDAGTSAEQGAGSVPETAPPTASLPAPEPEIMSSAGPVGPEENAGIASPSLEQAHSPGAVAGPTGPPRRPEPPLPLQGIYDGPVRIHARTDAGFRFELPAGWTVDDRDAHLIYINPGVAADSADQSPIFFTTGELVGHDRRRPVTHLVDQQEPNLVRVFAQLGVNLFSGTNEVPAAPVALGEFVGAIRTWNAELPDGRPAQIWFGATTRYDRYYSVFGVTPVGAVDQVQAGMRRILSSLRVAAPARNVPLERLLEGKQLASPGASPAAIHWFTPDNVVRRRIHRAADGAVFEDVGRFEVVGEEVWLFFPTGQNVGRMVREGDAFGGVHFGMDVHRVVP